MLMWCTQMFGLLTELNARPGERDASGIRDWANAPKRSPAYRAAYDKKYVCKCKDLTGEEMCVLRRYSWDYTTAWIARLLPHVLGFFPYISVWVIMLNHFFESLNDLKVENMDCARTQTPRQHIRAFTATHLRASRAQCGTGSQTLLCLLSLGPLSSSPASRSCSTRGV